MSAHDTNNSRFEGLRGNQEHRQGLIDDICGMADGLCGIVAIKKG